MKRIAIIGSGSWGTALSIIAARCSDDVRLWSNNNEVIESIRTSGQNKFYLPGFRVPSVVRITDSFQDAVEGAEMLITAVPSHAYRSVFKRMVPHLDPDTIIVSATKGIENDTLMRMSNIVEAEVEKRFEPKFVALSGPTFALEVAKCHPTAAVVASVDIQWAQKVQQTLSGQNLRLYTNNDVTGVELCGAAKNIIAIAAGVVSGLGYGYNTIAAIITRGIAEITRLVLAQGGRAETVAGLAGVGDLMLTCFGALSRNRSVGIELGKGHPLSEITSEMRQVAEGISTTRATAELARRLGIEMPITSTVYKVLYEDTSVESAARSLMERPLKRE